MAKNGQPTKKTYKNMPTSEKNEYLRQLFYEDAQNLKMPFTHFMQRKYPVIIGIIIFTCAYLYTDGKDGVLGIMANFAQYYLGILAVLYKFSHLKYEDILNAKEETK